MPIQALNIEASPRLGSIAAMRWSAIDAIGRQSVTFAVTLILARLLSPAEFGLVGMLSIFVAVATSLVDSGFGTALIQRRHITEADRSSVFYFNASMGVAGAVVLSVAAPAVARFYAQPLLSPILRWMALNLIIGSLGVVQVALLTRDLDFLSQFKAGFLGLVVSGLVAVVMAMSGWGVWSLVAQTLAFSTVFTATLWCLCSWRPHARFDRRSLSALATFGTPLLASGLLNVVVDRANLAIIGKSFSATQLGYYSRAYSTQQFPSGLLSAIVGRVMLPVFADISGNVALLRRKVKDALVSLMAVTLPIMCGIAVVAYPLVLLLFGRQWLPCVPYLQLLSIAGACWPIHIVNLNITIAMGRTDLFLKLEIIKKLLIVAGLLCTFRISVLAMVWSTVVVSMVSTVVNSHYSESLIQYGFRKQLADLAPYIGLSILMAGAGLGVRRLFRTGPVRQLLLEILACALCYTTGCYLLRLRGWTNVRYSLLRKSLSESVSPRGVL